MVTSVGALSKSSPLALRRLLLVTARVIKHGKRLPRDNRGFSKLDKTVSNLS